MKLLGWIVAFVLIPSMAAAQQAAKTATCGTPIGLDDGWQVAAPEAVGMDGLRLCSIATRLQAQNANVHAVVIVRHGKLVFEQYFPGYDDPWGAPDGQFSFDATTRKASRLCSSVSPLTAS